MDKNDFSDIVQRMKTAKIEKNSKFMTTDNIQFINNNLKRDDNTKHTKTRSQDAKINMKNKFHIDDTFNYENNKKFLADKMKALEPIILEEDLHSSSKSINKSSPKDFSKDVSGFKESNVNNKTILVCSDGHNFYSNISGTNLHDGHVPGLTHILSSIEESKI